MENEKCKMIYGKYTPAFPPGGLCALDPNCILTAFVDPGPQKHFFFPSNNGPSLATFSLGG
jgi:hypothetical protein